MLLSTFVLAAAFVAPHGPIAAHHAIARVGCPGTITMGYVPDGMSKEQYEKMKANERAKSAGKNLGVTGVTTFRSRTLDFRAADEARAQGEKKAYRFPDPFNRQAGNKANYVRVAGGKETFRQSKEYKQMLAKKEAELKRQREASAKITGAAGGFRAGGAKRQAAKKAAKKAAAPGGGNFLSNLFGGK